jgi:hypothetical protein
MAKVQEYADFDLVRGRLANHRPDRLSNLAGIGALTWKHLFEVLETVAGSTARDDEREFARRATDWLAAKGLARDGV